MKMYLLEKIKDSKVPFGWRAGDRIWAEQKCKGLRVVKTMEVHN